MTKHALYNWVTMLELKVVIFFSIANSMLKYASLCTNLLEGFVNVVKFLGLLG